ncbi:MAG: 50S ribosomal protein L28 [Candidatus Sericytochromatia bacterium]|nr:50S ribosomal protein L28 [Candidatus Sericytochromatia bacterium]
MSRVCQITGKSYNNANNVSHSHQKTKYKQHVNLQWKKFWIPELSRWVRLKVSTNAIKTVSKYGLLSTMKRYGTDASILKK